MERPKREDIIEELHELKLKYSKIAQNQKDDRHAAKCNGRAYGVEQAIKIVGKLESNQITDEDIEKEALKSSVKKYPYANQALKRAMYIEGWIDCAKRLKSKLCQ